MQNRRSSNAKFFGSKLKFEFLEDCSFPTESLLGCAWTMYQIPTKENKVKIDDAPKEVIISLISPINEFNSPS